MPPDYGQEATQMFSQRNNPYCELLSIICRTNIKNKFFNLITGNRKEIKKVNCNMHANGFFVKLSLKI